MGPVRKPAPPDYWEPRARGALLGLAVGEALGVTHKGKRFVSPPFVEQVRGHNTIEGRGPFSLKAGQVGEPTQMATCLSASLVALLAFHPEDALRRYRAWRLKFPNPEAFTTQVLDIQGPQPGKTAWIDSQRRVAGPGALPRAAPLAVFFSRQTPAELERAVGGDGSLTHYHPRCQLSQSAMATAIAHALALSAPTVDPAGLFEAVDEALVLATERLLLEIPVWAVEVHAALADIRKSLSLARTSDPELYGPDLHLFRNLDRVEVPFRLAFFQLAQQRSFEDALVDVVNRGGDTDLNGAVTGALLGAVHGESAIPEAWRKAVLEAPGDKELHPHELLQLVRATPKPATETPKPKRMTR
ncbi:MAG: ADP-ribosylglycohydrolase family protein [Myxococcaceae bacterium]